MKSKVPTKIPNWNAVPVNRRRRLITLLTQMAKRQMESFQIDERRKNDYTKTELLRPAPVCRRTTPLEQSRTSISAEQQYFEVQTWDFEEEDASHSIPSNVACFCSTHNDILPDTQVSDL
jgi:hypothetical protein